MEDLLSAELEDAGAQNIKILPSGASFSAPIEVGYRACLWSRIANKVFLVLAESGGIESKEALIALIDKIPWHEHVSEKGTIWIDSSISNSFLLNSVYASQLTKDIIADAFIRRGTVRPSVDAENPDLRLRLSLRRDHCSISIDLSGESLHRRDYRKEAGPATLKENVAAAILLRAGWPLIASEGGPLVDPMCGTGTFLIEAGLIAGDIAPGLLRRSFGFLTWKKHSPELWEDLLKEARERRERGQSKIPPLVGFDPSHRAVLAAEKNLKAAGLAGKLEQRTIDAAEPPAGKPGLLVMNPPYGVRLSPFGKPKTEPQPGRTEPDEALKELYRTIGKTLTERFAGYKAALITGDKNLAFETGLKASKVNTLFNGAIPCVLALFDIFTKEKREEIKSEIAEQRKKRQETLSPNAEMLRNRLKRNSRMLKTWLSKEGISCYRLYDADIPEYSAAIDIYQVKGGTSDQKTETYALVQEYAAPQSIDPEKARHRFSEILTVTALFTGIDADHIISKTRMRQKGTSQYERLGESGRFSEIEEGGLRFLVNLADYLDTGIFLDHRLTRRIIQKEAEGKHMLNLFGYTGTASVYAAKGGALSTTTVDTSATYLEWAKKNLELNGFKGREHSLIREDVMEFLKTEKRTFGLIFCDPPSFSNSKDRPMTFDVQRDHAELIGLAVSRLAKGGVLIFSTNLRRFSLDESRLAGLAVRDISGESIPRDFSRNQKIHRCYRIQAGFSGKAEV